MKPFTFALSLALAATLHADVIHLATGKDLNGTVTGYGNLSFEINLDGGSDVRQSAATIKSIEFIPRPVKFEVRGRNALEGDLTAYGNGAFTIQADGKTESIPAMLVTSAKFSGSTKKFILISGGGPLDLNKILAPGKVTLVNFFMEGNANCKKLTPDLEKLNKEDAEVVLRKVDIGKIGTPVTKQFDIKGVPRTDVYGRKGKRTGTVSGVSMDALNTYIRVAKEGK